MDWQPHCFKTQYYKNFPQNDTKQQNQLQKKDCEMCLK